MSQEEVRSKGVKRVAIYVRVSTKDQSLDNQIYELNELATRRGWAVAGIYRDQGVSGSKHDRDGLARALAAGERGEYDIFLVAKLDRLSRSTIHFLNTAEKLQALGIDFVSKDDHIDTSTAHGRFQQTVFAAFAELEREMIRSRVMTGLEGAKRRGVKLGPPRVDVDMAVVLALHATGMAARQIARSTGVSHTTIYRRLKEWELHPNGPQFKSRDDLDLERAKKIARDVDRISHGQRLERFKILLEEGEHPESIAKKLGVSSAVVEVLIQFIKVGRL